MRWILVALVLAGCAPDDDRFVFDPSNLFGSHRVTVAGAASAVRRDTSVPLRVEEGGPSRFIYISLPRPNLAETACSEDACVIAFDASAIGSWGIDQLRWFSKHEFGHVAGLPHVCDSSNYMHHPDAC